MTTRQIITFLFFLLNFSELSYALEVQGHRGARGVRPENTLPAFQYALEIGVDTLELDAVVTKDGIVVVSHDPILNPDLCLDSKGQKIQKNIVIRTLTLEELKKFDCGSLINPKFPKQIPQPKTTIPTLAEVFDLVVESKLPQAKKIQFNIETKIDEDEPELTPAPEEFVKLILMIVKKYQILNRTTLQSFDFRTLKVARQLEPTMSLAILLERRPFGFGSHSMIKLLQTYQAQILSPRYQWLKESDIVEVHKIGARVIPWTPNEKNDWKKLIEWGVDGIITDDPKNLIDFLNNK